MRAVLARTEMLTINERVAEQRLLSVGVRYPAGHRGEQMPRTLILGPSHRRRRGSRRLARAQCCGASRRRGAAGNAYLVRHDERGHTQELTLFRAGHVSR